MPQLPMTFCQTCGVEGYSHLIIHCVQCKIVAIHRYCVDGPPYVDDDEVIWSCEDCVPRLPEPATTFRKSERVHSIIDREAVCRKARNNWRNHLSPLTDVADDTSDLDERKNMIVKRKQGKLKENGTVVKKGCSKPIPLAWQEKKFWNSDNGANKKSSEPFLLTRQKAAKDLNSFKVDGQDIQTKLEKNLCPQLSEESDHNLESTSKADERSDEDSVAEKSTKHGQAFYENLSSLLEEQQGIRSSQAAKQPDGAEYKASDNLENKKDVSQRDDKQSCFDIYEIQIPRKRRRLAIAVECSDSDEEPVCARDEHPEIVPDVGDSYFHMSSGEPLVKIGDHGGSQHYFIKPSDHSTTRPSPVKSANYMLSQASSIDTHNYIIPQRSPVIFDNYVPAQPIMNAVWRGYCSISSNLRPMSFELEAHLSNKAHAKVQGAASALPELLSFESEQKFYAWPKSFENSPPTSDSIGLYFFPVGERDEKWYEYLLDEMIDRDLVLSSHINKLNLLVFSSLELPREERRFQSKYYLWGVFKPKQQTSFSSKPPGNSIR